MNLIPKSGMILVEPFPTKPASSGLIQLADVADIPETSGVVIAIAESFTCPDCGAERIPELAVGDVVLFPASAGNLFELGGTKCLVMAESDVFGVVAPGVTAEVA